MRDVNPPHDTFPVSTVPEIHYVLLSTHYFKSEIQDNFAFFFYLLLFWNNSAAILRLPQFGALWGAPLSHSLLLQCPFIDDVDSTLINVSLSCRPFAYDKQHWILITFFG